MVDMNYTDVTFIIDKSGSMLYLTSDTIGGFNSFLKGQQGLPGKCLLSLVQFNGHVHNVYTGLDINYVAPLGPESYRAEGWTALLDALGETITKTGQRFASMREDERPGKVLFIIITDGQENSSREYTKARIKEMIKKQEGEYKWNFTFMGADLASITEARELGFSSTHAYTHSSTGVNAVYTSADLNLRSYRASGQSVYTASVTPEEIENQTK